MKKIFPFIFFIFAMTIACKMPKPDQAIAMMDLYWNFYKVGNFDSLETFYIVKGDSADEKYFWNALRKMRENGGNIRKISLTSTSIERSLNNGESIGLAYEVEFEKFMVKHEFVFKKNEKGVLRISNHEFND